MASATPARSTQDVLHMQLQPYHPAWPRMFEHERDRLWHLLSPMGGVVAIEQIGATAVPALQARPVIDMVVGVTDLGAEANRWIGPITREEGGYQRASEFDDVIPGTIALVRPAAEHARGFMLYLTTAGTATWESMLLFRDRLRSHFSQVGTAYDRVRAEALQSCEGNAVRYLQAKRAFIESECERAIKVRNETERGQRFQIRRLSADDLGIALSVVRRFKRPQSAREMEEYLSRVLRDPKMVMLAAVASPSDLASMTQEQGEDAAPTDDLRPGPDPTPIGFALAYVQPRIDTQSSTLFFHDVSVDPVFRGRGVGARLTEEMIRLCDKLGCSQMLALTSASNRVAMRLHESKGAQRPNRNDDILFVYDFDH